MNEEIKQNIPKDSWFMHEGVIESLGMNTAEEVKIELGKSKWSDILNFLKNINMVNDAGLTDIGKEYFRHRFILKDEEFSKRILATSLKQLPPVQAICQLLWGKPNLTKESIYRLLALEGYINPHEFKEPDLGGFLMLLNWCDILKYSKKTNRSTVLYNPRSTEETKPTNKFLSPETPYSNVKHICEILRNSTGFVYWFDKHFSTRGLEPLVDEVDGSKVKEIRILAGITNRGINEKLKRDFIRFREEMKTRHIDAELRVLCDKSLLNGIHDRWVMSEKNCFNVPPVNSIFQGQYSEIKETKNRPPFEAWWLVGLDIIKNWDEITTHLKNECLG